MKVCQMCSHSVEMLFPLRPSDGQWPVTECCEWCLDELEREQDALENESDAHCNGCAWCLCERSYGGM
jgi:hypothetical protein